MQLLSCDPKEVRRNAVSARALRPPWHTCSRKTLRGKRFLGFLGVKGESAAGRAGQTLELEEKLGVGTIRDRAQTLPPHFPGLSDTQGWQAEGAGSSNLPALGKAGQDRKKDFGRWKRNQNTAAHTCNCST